MVFMQEFRGKRMMGHTFRRYGFKIKVKWKGIGKKKMQFSGLFFFNRSLKLVHTADFGRLEHLTVRTWVV